MNETYDPAKIESKWQKKWVADQLYRSAVDWSKPKHYALTMLPYPSGDLHIGHWFAMTPSDTRARYMRMKGYNVLFPMGFDAFGLPAENAAVQHNIHPKEWTYANIENMRKQLKSMGAMFDWKREAISCEPKYYRWTEWFFKKLHEAGLAYRGEALVNWSPTLQTVLANEQVIDGRDERNGQPVIQKMMTQWFFRITKYAEGLLDFSKLDWPEPIKIMQTNWIGRSEGAWVTFHAEQGDPIEIFTTRPDTLWGATFMVLAPEHPLVEKVTSAQQRKTVDAYKAQAARVTEIERTNEEREKTGMFTGGYAINPVNNERIPIWIADYVLITYGSGAIMAVPAHDERDFAFAHKYGIEVRVVIQPDDFIQPAGSQAITANGRSTLDGATMTESYVGAGVMFNSGPFDGTPCNEEKGRKNPGISAVIDWLEKKGIGREAVNYRLRDWLISRQRYWGAPIPAVHTQDGKIENVPEESLPVLLPDDVQFMPTGQSPLLFHQGFLNTSDSQGRPARRETDTMDTFMCSSWYQYRYLSPNYDKGPFDPEEAAYWLPVDVYTGGAEHATMHLMYTRFFTKAMFDLGMLEETREAMKAHGRNPDELIDEPMIVLRNQGQILGEERGGNFILAKGRWEGKKLVADYVEVIDPANKPADSEAIYGEIMHRTENILQVDTGGRGRSPDLPLPDLPLLQVVEVSAEAKLIIPSIPGEANVNQLKHHLEIQRMSKSKGNVVDPDELVARYGADTVRGYLMFAFDWTKGGPWDSQGIMGVHRFLNDVWRLVWHWIKDPPGNPAPAASGAVAEKDVRALRRKVHQTIQRVTYSLETFSFNTGMAALMELKNAMSKVRGTPVVHTPAWDEAVRTLLLLMAPFTPYVAEELWGCCGGMYSIHQQSWPQTDPVIAAEEEIELVVQVNGKVRDRIRVPADISEEDARKAALTSEAAQRFMEGKPPRKIIVVPGKLVNIVI